MVKIRLSKGGRKKAAFYRIVAVSDQAKNAGRNLEILGFWNPIKKELKIEKEALNAWVKKGAQLSPTVKKLVEGKPQK